MLYLGIISPIIFWLTTIICGAMTNPYNHLSDMVSELGALNSRPQYIFTTGLVLSSILNIFFVIGLYKVCKTHNINTIPVLFLLFFSFLAGPGIIPMPLPLHGIVGIPFPLLVFSPFFALILWRSHEYKLKIRVGAALSLFIMLLGFLIFFPEILTSYFGLKQRFLYMGWTLWSGLLAIRFLRLT